jgi:exodeoxyribonuclease-3
MRGVVSHTPIEIEKMDTWQKSHNWVDAVRHFVPPEEKLYSWWSYRAADWAESNRGRRLDHIWVTPDLVPGLKKQEILRDARGWEPKPSDHVPVIVEL